MAKKHVLSKEELREPDEVLTLLDRLWEFSKEHAKGVSLTILGIILLTVVYYTVKYMLHSRDAEASRSLIMGVEHFMRPVDEEKAGKKAEPGERVAVKSIKEKYEAAIKALDKGIDDCGGDACAVLHVLRAKAELELSRLKGDGRNSLLKKAISDIEAALDDLTEPLQIPALEILGAAHEELKEYDKAIAAYQKLATREGGVYAGIAMINQARVYELKGETQKAVELYKEVVKTKSTGLVEKEKARLLRDIQWSFLYYQQVLQKQGKDSLAAKEINLHLQALMDQQRKLEESKSVLDPGEYARKRLAFLDLGLTIASAGEAPSSGKGAAPSKPQKSGPAMAPVKKEPAAMSAPAMNTPGMAPAMAPAMSAPANNAPATAPAMSAPAMAPAMDAPAMNAPMN